MSLEVGWGHRGPERKQRNPGVLKMPGITTFKMRACFVAQGGMEFQKVIVPPFNIEDIGEEKPPLAFAVSPELRRGALQSGINRKLLDAVRKYSITRITNNFNRIWVKKDGERIPVVLTWQELGKLSSDLGVEMADLTCFVLEATDGGLRVSREKNDPGTFYYMRMKGVRRFMWRCPAARLLQNTRWQKLNLPQLKKCG